jgi:pyruvate-formate lyase-activating enzyme
VADNKESKEMISGNGIKTSEGVVLLSCNLACRVCGNSDLFEWPEQKLCTEDVEGIDTLGLIIAVAHSKNWIAQRVINDQDGKRSLFVLCPTCLALFFSATTTQAGKDVKDKT